MDKNTKSFIKIGFWIAFILIFYGVVIHIIFPKWGDSGVFGDSYGALNSLFSGLAFAGIIVTILLQKGELEYQRKELSLQREEMRETRIEFSIQRITGIIYKQLERFELAKDELVIDGLDGKVYKGLPAVVYLDDILNANPGNIHKEESLEEKIERINDSVEILLKNTNELLKFSISAFNAAKVVKEVLLNSDLGINDLRSLKNLFFRNIGVNHLGVLEDMLLTYDEYKEIESEVGVVTADFTLLGDTYNYLKLIVEFRKVQYAEENIAQMRQKFIDELGEYA